jgi:hypothetical protein
MHKLMPPLVCEGFQVAQIPRIGEFVQVHNGSRIPFHPLQDEIGSDKTCPTCDEDRVFHIVEVALDSTTRDRSARRCLRANL